MRKFVCVLCVCVWLCSISTATLDLLHLPARIAFGPRASIISLLTLWKQRHQRSQSQKKTKIKVGNERKKKKSDWEKEPAFFWKIFFMCRSFLLLPNCSKGGQAKADIKCNDNERCIYVPRTGSCTYESIKLSQIFNKGLLFSQVSTV